MIRAVLGPERSPRQGLLFMTQEELEEATMQLQSDVAMLATTFESFLEDQTEYRKRREAKEKIEDDRRAREAEISATQYQKAQSFLSKHGGKILALIASAVTAFLAWYGSEILNAYKQEEKQKQVDQQIEKNSNEIVQFKLETTEEFTEVKDAIVETQILQIESYKHLEDTFKAGVRVREDRLPEKPAILKKAEEQAERDKIRRDLFKD